MLSIRGRASVSKVTLPLGRALLRTGLTPDAMTVIGTGGVASLFEGATDSIDHFDPDLTIRGLLEIWRRNTHLTAE